MHKSLHWGLIVVSLLGGVGLLGAGWLAAQAAPPERPPAAGAEADNPNPPERPVRLIFIHHSSGGYWLADDFGGLGQRLSDTNYFVSDITYGWTVNGDAIGDRTDIGNWWEWLGNGRRGAVLSALYTEAAQTDSFGTYARRAQNPAPVGVNEIILLKSCFPNSDVQSPDSPIPPIVSNPLRAQWAGSSDHTLANIKGIYLDLLSYFATRPDKLFVVITAPPRMVGDGYRADWGANARTLNNWLVDDKNGWLSGYAYKNVAVFDYFNVLTGVNNHHRYVNGQVEHITADANNSLAYSYTTDSHPSAAGDQKATAEFVPLLNTFYHRWENAKSMVTSTVRVGALVVSVALPKEAMTQALTVTLGTAEALPITSGLRPLEHEFFGAAWTIDTGTPVYTFSQGVTLTVDYANANLMGIQADTLGLRIWNPNTHVWDLLETSHNISARSFTATIHNFGTFGVIGQDLRVYLPIISTNVGS